MNNPSDREVAVFNGALQLPAAERAAFLEQACAGDDVLRRKIGALLQVHNEVGAFLENPTQTIPFPAPPAGPSGTVRVSTTLIEQTGERIGPYKLLQQLGEGGCGVVYMAEQSQPVRRKVALKVIKLGMDTKSVIARFEAERQALALMEHPNIAKVLDAGATDAGRPFFVMELVKGVRITDYCDQNNLATAERLKLFAQVCHAIQHAHQKGIIHRDIKPSNILVTMHDGVPVPKVIDFGIAKATTDQPLTDKTLFTAFEQFMGTPAYMSPEQAEMTGLDIDTRSDIYALGVLLYELLTGKTPFDPKELLASGLEAMRRTIREREPERPSTRLSTMVAADLTTVARQRQSDAPRLIHLVRGDLDWIVMKALEKDRTRRYETANGLAMDVQRYLANEPVVARPPSTLYRLQKLAHRNRLAFVAASAVAAALVGGLTLSTVLFIRERSAHQRAVAAEEAQVRLRREAEFARADEARLRLQAQADERQAKTEATKSRHVARFLEAMLEGVGPSAALGRDTTMLREILNKTAVTVGQELQDQPEVQAELQSTIGKIYYELGEYDQAAAMHREALAKREKLFGSENRDTATSLYNLAYALYRQENFKEAETLARQALAVRQKLLGIEDRDVAASLNILANVLNAQGRSSEAETIYRRNLALQQKLENDEGTAQALNNLALILRNRGDVAGAESMFREALAMYRKALGNGRPELAMALHNLSETLRTEHKLGEAEGASREAWTIRKKLFGGEHPFAGQSLDVTIWVLEDQGRLLEAEVLAREALATARLTATNNPARLEERLDGLANVQRHLGRHAEAEILYREALASARSHATNDPTRLEYRAVDLVTVLRPQKKFAEAEALSREALALARQSATNDPGAVVGRTADLAGVLEEEGRMADAEACYREGIVEQRKLVVEGDSGLSTMLQNLADLLVRENKATEAEAMAREALSLARLTATNDPARIENNLAALANARRSLGKNAEAEPLYREALASTRRFATNDPSKLQFREADLVTVLRPQRKYAEAEALSRDAWAIARQIATNEPGALVARTADLAGVLEEQGWPGEAESCYRDSLADLNRLAVKDESACSAMLQNLADLLVRDGKLGEAETRYREAVARRRKLSAGGNLDLAGSLHNLGDTLAREEKLEDAEVSYREALALRRKLSGTDDRDTLGSLNNLSDVLAREGKREESRTLKAEATALYRRVWTKNPAAWENELSAWAAGLVAERKFAEAEQLFKDILNPEIEGTAQAVRFRRAEGIFFGRRGLWKRAAADLAEVIAKDPASRDQDHRLAALLVASGDLAGYREQCQQMVVHFGGTNDPLTADRMAKACLLLPSSGADPAVVAQWVETALTRGTNSGGPPWNQWLKGLAEYRLGHFAAAAEWMPTVLRAKGQPERDAQACLVLAMSRQKLNQDPEARAALTQAIEITKTKMALPDSGDFGDSWFDWIVVQTLMHEARGLIEGGSVTEATNLKSHE